MKRRCASALGSAGLMWCLLLGLSPRRVAAAPDTCLDEEACTLGTECERWGESIQEAELPTAACAATTISPLAMAWVQPLSDIACPFGRCTLYRQQLTLDADGTLVTLGNVQLPSQHGTGQEGGLWLTRHTPSGVPLATGLWDFSVPPPGIELERNGALLRDGSGRALFVSSRAVLPFDAARALSARTLSRGSRLAPSSSQFSTAAGWGVSAALGPAGEWVVASLRTRPARASVTRFTPQGRISWRRTWPVGSEVQTVQVAPDQAIIALVFEPSSGEYVVYKLDPSGTVQWRRAVGGRFEASKLAVDAAGLIYIVRSIWDAFPGEVRILQLDAAGHAVVQWNVPDQFIVSPALATDELGHAAAAIVSFGAGFTPTLDWHDLADGMCARTSYQWPSMESFPLTAPSIYADRHGARFFANSEQVGQLQAGGAP
jgi:hypothetical protein